MTGADAAVVVRVEQLDRAIASGASDAATPPQFASRNAEASASAPSTDDGDDAPMATFRLAAMYW